MTSVKNIKNNWKNNSPRNHMARTISSPESNAKNIYVSFIHLQWSPYPGHGEFNGFPGTSSLAV